MSRYTTEFRHLFDNYNDEMLGLAQYPIFDETYRERLNSLIKNTYAFEEINFETPARFCWYLRNKMQLIMPYYNKLYDALLLNFDPFVNVDIQKDTYDVTSDKTSTTRDLDATDKNTSASDEEDKFDGQDIRAVDKTYQNTDNTDTDSVSTTLGNSSGLDTTTRNGGTETISTGGYTNTRSGSEVDNNKKGEIYEHGLNIGSVTPEGFVQTDTITNDTWASNAEKFRKSTEQREDDKNTHTYNNVMDVMTYNNQNVKNIFLPESKDVKDWNETHDDGTTGNTHTDVMRAGSENVTDDTVHDTIRKIQQNAKSTLEKIESISEAINKNGDRLGDEHTYGFNGITMSQMLKEFTESMVNVDKMILDELSELFISIVE